MKIYCKYAILIPKIHVLFCVVCTIRFIFRPPLLTVEWPIFYTESADNDV